MTSQITTEEGWREAHHKRMSLCAQGNYYAELGEDDLADKLWSQADELAARIELYEEDQCHSSAARLSDCIF